MLQGRVKGAMVMKSHPRRKPTGTDDGHSACHVQRTHVIFARRKKERQEERKGKNYFASNS